MASANILLVFTGYFQINTATSLKPDSVHKIAKARLSMIPPVIPARRHISASTAVELPMENSPEAKPKTASEITI